MNLNRSIELLDILLKTEIAAGRPPGSVPPGIYDGPKKIEVLLTRLKGEPDPPKWEADIEARLTTRELVISVWGGYLGRGDLIRQLGLYQLLPSGFNDKLERAIDFLREQR